MHGDDFTVTGPLADLQWIQRRMEEKYEIKTHYLGPGSGMTDEIQILNRTLRWTKEGITCEADQRHAEIVIQDMLHEESKRGVFSSGARQRRHKFEVKHP